jgi:hypothetical protein
VWDVRFQTRYPSWVAVLLGTGFGAIGYLLIAGGLVAGAGWSGPVVVLLAPALVGVVAELVIRAGWGVAGLALGTVVAAQVTPALIAGATPPAIAELVLYLAAGTIGYTVGAGILLAPTMPDFTPPPAADIVKAERQVRTQLRAIDPEAPGAFERATVLLRQVNDEVDRHTGWQGPNPLEPAGRDAAAGLLELQAEVVEATRIAAMRAGARRVTVASNGPGGGIDVEAVFGDDGPAEDDPARPLPDVD